MSINVFFHISKEFFDQMYSQGIEYEEETTTSGDEEKGFEEWFEQKNEEFCCYNLFLIITQILSFIELKKCIKYE
jgi:hypothetical protein